MLKTYTTRTKFGYRGYIKCVDGKRILWREGAGIDRICREDAQEDANRLRNDRQNTWKE